MNSLKKTSRIVALALCLIMAMSFAMPAMAASIAGYAKVLADNTPVYGDAGKSSVIGNFNKDDLVAIESKITASGVYVVRQTESGAATGYISITALGTVGGKTASQTVAAMKTVSGGTAVPTETTTTTSGSGQAGYITNVKSNVNFRKQASTSGGTHPKLSLNEVITVYEKTNGYYRVTNSAGTVGYVAEAYVALGTPPAKSSSSSSSASTGTGTIVNCKADVNFRATASSSGKKLGVLKLGETVTVLGTSGKFYKVTNSKGVTGFVSKDYVKVSGGSSGGGGAVGYADLKVEPNKSEPSSSILTGFETAKKANPDAVGYMAIPNTNIKFPIMYKTGDVNYYDNHDSNGNSATKGAVHSFYGTMTRNNIITAHNMRGSNDMFHQLSHLYDKAAGQSTCQTTDYKCTASNLSSTPNLKTGKHQWEIYSFGYTTWEVWAMYKTEASEPTSTINTNIHHLSTYTKEQIESWISTQKGRSIISTSTTVSANDVFLTLYTCGTNFDNAAAQSRIYIFLKAVK